MDLKQQCENQLCNMPPKLREVVEPCLASYQKVITFDRSGIGLSPDDKTSFKWTIILANQDGTIKVIKYYESIDYCTHITLTTYEIDKMLKNFKRNFKKNEVKKC